MAFYAPARSPLAHSYSPLLLEGVIEVCQAQGQGTGTLDLHGACQHPILEEYVGWWISCCPLWEIDPATGGLQRSRSVKCELGCCASRWIPESKEVRVREIKCGGCCILLVSQLSGVSGKAGGYEAWHYLLCRECIYSQRRGRRFVETVQLDSLLILTWISAQFLTLHFNLPPSAPVPEPQDQI